MTLNILIVAQFLADCRMTALRINKGISTFNFHYKSRDLLHDAKSSHQRLLTKIQPLKKFQVFKSDWCKKPEVVLKCVTFDVFQILKVHWSMPHLENRKCSNFECCICCYCKKSQKIQKLFLKKSTDANPLIWNKA